MHAVQNIANVLQCYSLLSGQYDIKEFLGLNCRKYIYVCKNCQRCLKMPCSINEIGGYMFPPMQCFLVSKIKMVTRSLSDKGTH